MCTVSSFYVVYDHPDDYPDHVILRHWEAVVRPHTKHAALIPGPASFFTTLDDALLALPVDAIMLPADPRDDPRTTTYIPPSAA